MFKIYYDDGSVVVSLMEGREDGNPLTDTENGKIKFTGVIAVVQDDLDVGWTILTGYEYYVYRDSKWVGTDFWGVLDYLEEDNVITLDKQGARRNGKKVDMVQLRQLAKNSFVISGRMITKSQQEDIFADVYTDPDLDSRGDWTYPERAITVRAPRGKKYADKKRGL